MNGTMKKRLLSLLLTASVSVTALLGLSSCGKEEEMPEEPKEHTHTYSEKYIFNSNHHWYPATCEHTEEIKGREEHTIQDGACTKCGYVVPLPEETLFTVTVKDGTGEPLEGMLVEFFKGDESKLMKFTGTGGTLTATLPTDEYTFSIRSASGEPIHYDESLAVLTPSAPDVTVTVFTEALDKVDLMVEGGGAVSVFGLAVTEGQYYASFSNEEMTYYVFTAQRSGIFEVTFDSTAAVEVGYYGIPAYVRLTDQTLPEDRIKLGSILIDVAPSNLAIADERPATPYVIGVKGRQLSGTGVLKITRVGDHETTLEDLPWHTYGMDVNPTLYAPEGELALTDVDLTDPAVKLVFSEADGFYHYMTEDGPTVYMKIDLATEYLDPISAMCGPQHFGAPLYDEDGKLIRKETYHEMTLRYIAASEISGGGIGVYPLDDHLITMIKNLGNAWGWYDLRAESPTQIFADQWENIVPENAWMFALCYGTVEA